MDMHATEHKITPRSVSESAEIARRVISHTTAQNVHFSLPAAVIAGLLVGIDELARLRAADRPCRCGPEGCADSTCPGRCGGAS